ncbi:protein Bre4p [Monosporozyma unispora]|nr:hypothetical protein C6P44_001017 [Kazachstania unispora]
MTDETTQHSWKRLGDDIRPKSLISKGSYNQQSYLSLMDLKNRSKNKKKDTKSPQISSPNSYSSLSQLRLSELAESHHWDQLDDFELEELRDGFFDAIYTKPGRKYNDLVDIMPVTANKSTTSPPFTSFSKIDLKEFYQDLKKRLSKEWVLIVKFFIPFFIAFVLCVIRPTGNWIGHKYRYFLPIGVILHHPVRNIGVQFEITFFSLLGITFALGWSSLAWYVSTATGPTASHQGGILFQSLTMALIFSTWLKTYYQRFLHLSLSFGIIIIFTHSVSLVFSKKDLFWILFRDVTLSYVFGIILSLFTCILIVPHSGNESLMRHFQDTMDTSKNFLVGLINRETVYNSDELFRLKNAMIESLNIQLSQSYRDFFNQFSIAKFDAAKLEELRNSLTTFYSPLRVMPLQNKLLDNALLTRIYDSLNKNKKESDTEDNYPNIPFTEFNSESASPMVFSGSTTPKTGGLSGTVTPYNNFYISIMQKQFGKYVVALIVEMVIALETLFEAISIYSKYKSDDSSATEINKQLDEIKIKLKRRINKLDRTYKDFTKSNTFSNDLLSNPDCVVIFVFLRYLRNSAKQLLTVFDACQNLGVDIHWRLQMPQYPLAKALHRLPKQCAIDEGSDNFLHYYDTKHDVEEIFERVYNSYTSKHAYTKSWERKSDSVRAIDHDDFDLHTTHNKFRYKLWKFSKMVSGDEMKWSLKIVFCVIFLCLPTWLPESYHWYQEFQCWWGALIFHMLVHRKPTGGIKRLLVRLGIAICCIFWGWAANQARHFGSPYVICTFAGLLVIPMSINLLIYRNPKTTYAGLISFIVIVLQPYSKGKSNLNTAKIWKNTWITSLSLLIGITVSVCVNWIFWSYKARKEVRLAVSSLLSYLSQSYQSVTDRYLYRDLDDQPTELTLSFGRIREVRLTQNIEAIRGLLKRAKLEPNYISNFDSTKYEKLIDSCQLLLEKLIESRISGSYFQIWEQDKNKETTRALLSLRRDTVASVIFVFYILSNCFRSKNKIPKYLPNTILARKKLFDYINKLDKQDELPNDNFKFDSLRKKLFANKADLLAETKPEEEPHVDDYKKLHWTEVYGMVFASAFTDVSEAVDRLIDCCKDIVGEEAF